MLLLKDKEHLSECKGKSKLTATKLVSKNLNSAIELAGCYVDDMHSDLEKAYIAVRDDALANYQTEQLSQMGESRGRVDVSMCNAGNTGQVGQKGIGDSIQQIGETLIRSMAGTRE